MLAVCHPFGVCLYLNGYFILGLVWGSLCGFPLAVGVCMRDFLAVRQISFNFLHSVLITSFTRSLGHLSLIMPSCFYKGSFLIAGYLSLILNDLPLSVGDHFGLR